MKRSLLLSICLLLIAASYGQFSPKKVLFEEHTGAWCGYCVDGAVKAQQVKDAYGDNVIMVGIHDGDAMAIADGGTVANFYVTGYPMATVDRTGAGISRGSWMSAVQSRLMSNGYVTVSIDSMDYNTSTREVFVRVKALFTGNISNASPRFNLYIIEDHVTGSGTGYNQVNYDNTTSGHPYQGAGNPIIGFDHRHVLRDMLGGPWGIAGQIPSSVGFGDEYTYDFNYTLPASYDENEVHLVALIQDSTGTSQGQRVVYNSEEAPLVMATSMDGKIAADDHQIQAYPNPFSDAVTVSFTFREAVNARVSVYNMMGQEVDVIAEGIYNSGIHTIKWSGRNHQGIDLPEGVYFIRIDGGTETYTQKVVLNR